VDRLIFAEAAFAAVALGVAACFSPLQMLRRSSLQQPWLAALALLPWGWSAAGLAGPGGAMLQVSGACLLVLMLGWPLATWSLLPIALLGAWIGGLDPAQALDRLVWFGIAPALVALAAGAALRRWLPGHLFVYIFCRGFFATAMALGGCGTLHVLLLGVPRGLEVGDMLVGHWLLGWGEATTTGMLVAVMVAFRPQWLATYADRHYLPV
jgi:uncharacterized membrane protein